jgi:muramoyltetrapeptide carboxypeptidase
MLTRRTFLAASLFSGAHTFVGGDTIATETGSLQWEFLKEGDSIDVIAPSSPVDNPQERYIKINNYFSNTPFRVRIPVGLIEPTSPLEEANTIQKRAQFVYEAFESDSKAIWAIGGGGWGAEILDELRRYPKPTKVKPILGYSDVTALHIFANQYLGFPSIHSIVLGINGDISPGWNESGIESTLNILSGLTPKVTYYFSALNEAALNIGYLPTKIVGGNSLLVSALNGTMHYTLNTLGKFIFLESIADSPGQFSRKLMGLTYSKAIQDCDGVIFGDVIQEGGKPNSPEVQAQFDYIIERFANYYAPQKPVLSAKNLFGHGPINLPLPLNTRAILFNQGNLVGAIVSANQA